MFFLIKTQGTEATEAQQRLLRRAHAQLHQQAARHRTSPRFC